MKTFLKIFLASLLVVVLVSSISVSKSSRRSQQAWLGVATESVDEDMAKDFDLGAKHGAIIDEVIEDSPAEEAGLEEDDIIVEVDGDRVYDSDDLSDMIEDRRPDDKVVLSVVRDKATIKIEATLDKKPRWNWSNHYHGWCAPAIAPIPPIPPIPAIPPIPSVGHGYRGNYFIDTDRSDVYIGVQLTALGRQLGEYFGVEKGRGMLVAAVDKDSPADKAGVKVGDVVTSMDGERISEYEDVFDILEDMDEGDKVAVKVIRDKKEMTFDVELTERRRTRRGDDVYILDVRDGGYYSGDCGDLANYYFSGDFSDDYAEEMEEYAEEMKDFKEELKDLQHELKCELKDELKDLRIEQIEGLRDVEFDLRDWDSGRD